MQSMMRVLRHTQVEGRSTLIRVVLINHRVGVLAEQERWGFNADQDRSGVAKCAPDCRIRELDKASSRPYRFATGSS